MRHLARRRAAAKGALAAGEERARVPSTTQPERGGPTLRHPLVDGVGEESAQLFRAFLEGARADGTRRRRLPVRPHRDLAAALHDERVTDGDDGDAAVRGVLAEIECAGERFADRAEIERAAMLAATRDDGGHGGHDDAFAIATVEERARAEEIARTDEHLRLAIPDREGEVALEMPRAFGAPGAIGAEQEVARTNPHRASNGRLTLAPAMARRSASR